jgi:hypothetical protein
MVQAKPVWKQKDFLHLLCVSDLGILPGSALIVVVDVHYIC